MKALLAAALMVSVPTMAFADDGLCGSQPCDDSGLELLVLGVATVEMLPFAFAAADVIARPHSKVYGGIELGVGSLAAAINTAFLVEWGEFDTAGAVVAGLIALDVAVAAHGTYLLVRDRPAADTSARLVPTMVSTQAGIAPALGVVGSF